MTPLAAVSGILMGAGVWLVLFTLADVARPARPRGIATSVRLRRVLGCAAVAVGVVVVSGWPVLGALAALGMWWLPGMLGPDRAHERDVTRIQATASWIEQVRDLIASGAGLHQALITTRDLAPAPIRPDVEILAQDLRTTIAPETALRRFARRVNVPVADLAAEALAAAATRHAADLASLLGELARGTREQVAMLMRIARSRARVRTSMRIITATTLAVPLLVLAIAPSYLAPYATPGGQLILAVVGGIIAVSLAAAQRMSRIGFGPRVLTHAPTPESAP